MLVVKHLCKRYAGHEVVRDVSFQVKKGEAFALLGSNGAGKTTTIRMILGLAQPTSGEIFSGAVRTGYQPETPGFPPFLTGREILVYYARLQGMDRKAAGREADRLLALAGLHAKRTRARHYSKGMLQRLALSQALIGSPDLLILDEPTAGLDALGRVEIIRLLEDLKASGLTMVINSHILADIERICDRGLILDKGCVYRSWNREDDPGKSLETVFLETLKAVS